MATVEELYMWLWIVLFSMVYYIWLSIRPCMYAFVSYCLKDFPYICLYQKLPYVTCELPVISVTWPLIDLLQRRWPTAVSVSWWSGCPPTSPTVAPWIPILPTCAPLYRFVLLYGRVLISKMNFDFDLCFIFAVLDTSLTFNVFSQDLSVVPW